MFDCKTEIIMSIPNNSCCSHAFLNIAINSSSCEKKDNALLFNVNNEIKDKLVAIISNFYPLLELKNEKNALIVQGNFYNLLLDAAVREDIFSVSFFPNRCDRLTLLKSLFIFFGNFYCNDDYSKNSTGYQLEFVFKNENYARFCTQLLAEFDFKLKSVTRKNTFVVYTKNSSLICDLFATLGAPICSLQTQNNLAIRDVRNSTNRQNNCFDSNLDKTLSASSEQIKAINYIIDHYSIDYFDDNLKEVALARLFNPDVSLNDLKTLLNNKISRAGIKYRLDKIITMYKKLKGEEK